MVNIIVLGSINMDVVATVKAHPLAGETVFGSNLQYIPGGKGSNQAVAASRLADHVQLIGKIGNDAFGNTLQQFLATENLDLSHLRVSEDAPTGVALIAVNAASENTIIVVSGSNFDLGPDDVNDITIGAEDIVVATFEVPQAAALALFSQAKSVGAHTILNTAPATKFAPGLRPLIDTLILNETELAFYLERPELPSEPEAVHAAIQTWRGDLAQTVILTLGAQGAMLSEHGGYELVAGRTVSAVDTTGAGDCFVGALAAALSEGMLMQQAVHFANVAASLSVQQFGASTSMPRRNAVDAILANS